MNTYKHTEISGIVIEATDDKNILNIDHDFIKTELKKHGYLLFRNFDTSIEIYSKFVNNLSSRTTLDPARQFFSENAQLVDAGKSAIGLHIENGLGPVIPDFCWFYCKLAPDQGSQTTLCDGKVVYENMKEELKKIFDTTITYSRNIPEQIWKTYIAHELGNQIAPNNIDASHLKQIEEKIENLTVTLNEDNSIKYKFEISPVLNQDETPYFANSILGPSYNYEKPEIILKNGDLIDETFKDELSRFTEQFTVNVGWNDGDIVLIDNKRVMHGRREILTNKREIYNALSFS